MVIHDCKQELREVALKATPTRLAILQYLEKTSSPVDVASIQNHLEKKQVEANPATVFRILSKFTDRGLTKLVQLNEGKFRYELADQGEHHHLTCQNCGTIKDMSDCTIDILEKEIFQKKGFVVKSHSLEFFGLCEKCNI